MNRILLRPEQLSSGETAVLSESQSTHVRRVLKLGLNDTLRIGQLNGPIGHGRITQLETKRIHIHCAFGETPATSKVDLLLAMPRPKVMKRLWPALASIGLGRIVITNAARVERNYFDTQWIDPAFYTPLLIDGLQQSGDTHLPQVQIQMRLKPFIEDDLASEFPDAMRIMGDPYDRDAQHRLCPGPEQRILVAVGPEGGWDDYECRLLATHHFHTVSLGWRILRSDTACISLLTLAHDWSRAT